MRQSPSSWPGCGTSDINRLSKDDKKRVESALFQALINAVKTGKLTKLEDGRVQNKV